MRIALFLVALTLIPIGTCFAQKTAQQPDKAQATTKPKPKAYKAQKPADDKAQKQAKPRDKSKQAGKTLSPAQERAYTQAYQQGAVR